MSDVEKTLWRLPPDRPGSGQLRSAPTRAHETTIYNQQERFDWNATFVKQHKLQARRVQSNGLDASALGDTQSLIKLEEESVAQTGYNPYDSGLTAMKQSRKPPALHDLTRHNTHIRKSGK